MSVNIPPNPNVSTFNNLYWITDDTPLTESIANKLYLKFPVAQGTENLQTTNVQGTLTCNSTAIFNDPTTFNDDVSITTGKDLFLYDNQAIPTSSILRQDTGSLTIANNTINGSISLETTNGSGTTTTSLQLNKTKGATFTTDTYVEDSVFVLRDNAATTTQVNISYNAGQQYNFNLAPSTLNPTTFFSSYLDPAFTPITPLTISNTGISLQGTAPITFPDNTIQNSAFTGGTAGSYTNTNMTIDANGKISAISSGGGGGTPTLAQVLTAGNDANGNFITNISWMSANVPNQGYPSIGNVASLIPRMETISVNLTGDSDQIDQLITLTNNVGGTINYMVFPSIYYGYTGGGGGTFGYKDTANLIGNFIIHSRTTSGFYIYASKAGTGDNINIYLNCLVMYDTKGTDTPASYS